MEHETLLASAPLGDPGRGGDPLTDHLSRIVRRALRRPNDGSRLANAIRAAAERIHTGEDRPSSDADEIRVRQLARRLSALLSPDFREAPGRGAQRETVWA